MTYRPFVQVADDELRSEDHVDRDGEEHGLEEHCKTRSESANLRERYENSCHNRIRHVHILAGLVRISFARSVNLVSASCLSRGAHQRFSPVSLRLRCAFFIRITGA